MPASNLRRAPVSRATGRISIAPLYVDSKLTCPYARNWNVTNAWIGEKNWFAFSWRVLPFRRELFLKCLSPTWKASQRKVRVDEVNGWMALFIARSLRDLARPHHIRSRASRICHWSYRVTREPGQGYPPHSLPFDFKWHNNTSRMLPSSRESAAEALTWAMQTVHITVARLMRAFFTFTCTRHTGRNLKMSPVDSRRNPKTCPDSSL